MYYALSRLGALEASLGTRDRGEPAVGGTICRWRHDCGESGAVGVSGVEPAAAPSWCGEYAVGGIMAHCLPLAAPFLTTFAFHAQPWPRVITWCSANYHSHRDQGLQR